jgi:hypothetical protein
MLRFSGEGHQSAIHAMRMGPAAMDVQQRKKPTIFTAKDEGQTERMTRPTR